VLEEHFRLFAESQLRFMTTLYITHPECWRHEMGSWHPECPERLDAISDHLLSLGLMSYLEERQAPQASADVIARVHDLAYQQRLKEKVPAYGYQPVDQDTMMNPHTYEAALHAAGAAVMAVDAVMAGEAQTAFCSVRPPGHHAEPDTPMGFCF